MVHYANVDNCGLNLARSIFDGYSIQLDWFLAYPDNIHNSIAYNIYLSESQYKVFEEEAKFVSIDNSLKAVIQSLTPGQEYWFSVRPVEYDPLIINFLNSLPIANGNLRYYPTSLLRQNISATDLIIPLLDVENFPIAGFIRIGPELIQYVAVDFVNNNIIVLGAGNSTAAALVLQSNNQYYLPNSNNKGTGTLNNLTLVQGNPPAETWNILCIFVEQDASGNPIPTTAKFEAIGNISGSCVDGYGNFIVWQANGNTVSNGILSFSITETSQFHIGDSFLVQNTGYTAGTVNGRGANNTPITAHYTDGYDGYVFWNPNVSVAIFQEDTRFDQIYACQCRFDYPNFPFTILDGYKQVLTDILSTDLTAADAANIGFPEYDYSGWHRTDPVQLLTGVCVGSYIGGQMGCIDQYGNNNIFRGLNLEDQNTQRQDMLLSVTGRPALLIHRIQTGMVCNCYISSSEYPDDRCPFCLGSKFQLGWSEYFNPRRSDGRILVRTSPTPENLKMHEPGLESEFPVDMWTLTVPTIKTRDIIVLFDQDDNEEFRYEVSNVYRNNTIVGLDGGQKMNTFRIRKTDPAYQIRTFSDTSDFPTTINTDLSTSIGFPPHTHTVQINANVPDTLNTNPPSTLASINQWTGTTQGHRHEIIDGVVQTNGTGHSHNLILQQ